jgi:hypothetical protein
MIIFLLYLSIPIGIDPVETNEASYIYYSALSHGSELALRKSNKSPTTNTPHPIQSYQLVWHPNSSNRILQAGKERGQSFVFRLLTPKQVKEDGAPGGWVASSSGGLAGDQDGRVNLPWAAAMPELTVVWGLSGARSPWPAEHTHGAAGGALWGRARRWGCGRSDATSPQPAEHDCTRGGWHGAWSSWGARSPARMGAPAEYGSS